MSKTIHKDNYTITSRPFDVDEDDWDVIFKRDKRNLEKNRHSRKQNKGRNGKD